MRKRPLTPTPGFERENKPPLMEEGKFYDLTPPAEVAAGKFRRVRCEMVFPDGIHYRVEGIPEGSNKIEKFVLEFGREGIRVVPSDKQDFNSENKNDRTN